MTYEFTFNFKNTDSIYLTHDTNTLDNELLQFIINEDIFDLNTITNFTVDKL
jgi:hypothetical protein